MRAADDQFGFLWGILDGKGLWAGGTDVVKGDIDYADNLVSCAGAAFARRELSLAALTAVYQLHAGHIGALKGLPPKIARAVLSRPAPAPMFPDMPGLVPPVGNVLGVVQTRLFFDFLRRAWKGRWLIHQADETENGETIRSCEVAEGLVDSLKGKRLISPCIYRWYEC